MAITVTTLAKPELKLVLFSGGSHTASTTRYYRIQRWGGSNSSYSSNATKYTACSVLSDEANVTFDTTNKKVAIFTNPPSGSEHFALVIFRGTSAGFSAEDNNAATSYMTNAAAWSIPQVVNTTVDADSNSGQKVLNVTSTTSFSTSRPVIIGWGTAREEYGNIASIQAGVSLTLTSNLTYTHTAAQADTVYMGIYDDYVANATKQPDWVTPRKCAVLTEYGMAHVQVTGTVSWDDIYQNASLKELYIFRKDTDSDTNAYTGGGYYDAYISIEIGDTTLTETVGTTTALTIGPAVIKLRGRMSFGVPGLGGGRNTTLTCGTLSTNTRSLGPTFLQVSWAGRQHWQDYYATTKYYNTTFIETSRFIAAAALETLTAAASALGWGNDLNFLVGTETVDWQLLKFDGGMLRNTVRSVTRTSANRTYSDLFFTGVNPENANNDASGSFYQRRWVLEAPTYGMDQTSGNASASDNGDSVTYDNWKLVDCVTAEAGLGPTTMPTYWIDPEVVGGGASTTNFRLAVNRFYWYSSLPSHVLTNLCFRLGFIVVDAASGDPISGATVNLYIGGTPVTLAKYLTFNSAGAPTQNNYTATTNASGVVARVPVVYDVYDPAGTQGANSFLTDTLSGHVTSGYFTKTEKHPFYFEVSKAGYATKTGIIDQLTQATDIVVSLGTPTVNGSPVLVFGVRES